MPSTIHAVSDFVSVALVQLLGPVKISTNVVAELVIAVFGLIALWLIWALRDRTGESVGQEPQTVSEVR